MMLPALPKLTDEPLTDRQYDVYMHMLTYYYIDRLNYQKYIFNGFRLELIGDKEDGYDYVLYEIRFFDDCKLIVEKFLRILNVKNLDHITTSDTKRSTIRVNAADGVDITDRIKPNEPMFNVRAQNDIYTLIHFRKDIRLIQFYLKEHIKKFPTGQHVFERRILKGNFEDVMISIKKILPTYKPQNISMLIGILSTHEIISCHEGDLKSTVTDLIDYLNFQDLPRDPYASVKKHLTDKGNRGYLYINPNDPKYLQYEEMIRQSLKVN